MSRGSGYIIIRYKGYTITRTDKGEIQVHHNNNRVFSQYSNIFTSIKATKDFLRGYTGSSYIAEKCMPLKEVDPEFPNLLSFKYKGIKFTVDTDINQVWIKDPETKNTRRR